MVRRYYTGILPVQHINGKMAPVKIKCSNSAAPEEEEDVSFFYGYRHKNTPNISRFGIRTQRRNLTNKPYSPQEDENRILFTSSLKEVHAHKKISGDWALMTADFLAQNEYATAFGFAVAVTRENGGVWPNRWSI